MFGMWDLPQNIPGVKNGKEDLKQDLQGLVKLLKQSDGFMGAHYTILCTFVYFENFCNQFKN